MKNNINKSKLRRYLMDVLFIVIFIYIIYAVYLLLKTPTDTFTVETGVLTQEESSVRSYYKRRNGNKG